MDQILVTAAKQLEKQLDSEIDRLDNLTVDDIDSIREKRLKEMKARQEKMIQWKSNVRRRVFHIRSFFYAHTRAINFLGSWRILRIG
jgi:hypothetical protein